MFFFQIKFRLIWRKLLYFLLATIKLITKNTCHVKFQLSDQNIFLKITLNLFFKIYIVSWIVFFYIFSAKRLQKSARNRHKCQFFMEKIYPWNSPMCFQVLLYCFQLGTEYIWHRNIWFLLSLLCFKMRRNPFWNRVLTIMPMCFHKILFTNMSTKLLRANS